jgi:predicted ATPase
MLASDLVPSTSPTSSEEKITNSLKSFAIYGLFGYQDIVLPLDQQVLILVAENGSGKTTVLNSIYYALTQNIEKLEKIDFQEIGVNFTSQNSSINLAKLKKLDIQSIISKSITPESISLSSYSRLLDSRLLDLLVNKQEIPQIVSSDKLSKNEEVYKNKNEVDSTNPCEEFQEIISNNLNLKLLFFPTYRRIEEDLSSLGYGDIKLKNNAFALISKLLKG